MKLVLLLAFIMTFGWSQTVQTPARPAQGSKRGGAVAPRRALTGTDHFTAVCASPGTVRCVDFETPVEHDQYADPGQDPDNDGKGGYTNGTMDSSTAASGASSFLFTIPAIAGADTSGDVHFNFSPDLSSSFGEGQEFFVQWRQKMDDNYLTNTYLVGGGCPPVDGTPRTTVADCPGDLLNGGMKQIIIGPQDTDSSPGSQGKHYSCELPHIVVTMGGARRMPVMYHSCGAYEGFTPAYVLPGSTVPSFLEQSAVPCPYSSVTGKPAPDPCVKYVPNEWMTVQIHVKVGHWYVSRDYNMRRDSTVEMWLAREDQPSILVQSMMHYSLRNNATDATPNQPGAPYAYGKVWLLPYSTGRDPNGGPYPEAHIWYDSVVISTTRVPDPGVSLQPPTGLTGNAGAYPIMTLNWVNNPDASGEYAESATEVQRCTGQMYDCIAGSLAKTSWQKIGAVPAGVTTYEDNPADSAKAYTYRVRATDGSNFSAYSNPVVNLPVPPYDLTANTETAGIVRLAWMDNSDSENQFSIERCEGYFQYYRTNTLSGQAYHSLKCLDKPLEEGGKEVNSFSEIARVPGVEGSGNPATFDDTTVTPGTTYAYRVRALNPAGVMRFFNTSRMGHSSNVTVTVPPPAEPGEPQPENARRPKTKGAARYF